MFNYKSVLVFLCALSVSYTLLSQNNTEPEILIFNAEDSLFLAKGYKAKASDSVNLKSEFNNDTLNFIFESYSNFEFTYPIDSTFRLEKDAKNIYLSKDHSRQFLKNSNLIYTVSKYGLMQPMKNEKLEEKYGVEYVSAGCVYDPTEIQRLYAKYVARILLLRNGEDWENRYQADLKKRKYRK